MGFSGFETTMILLGRLSFLRREILGTKGNSVAEISTVVASNTVRVTARIVQAITSVQVDRGVGQPNEQVANRGKSSGPSPRLNSVVLAITDCWRLRLKFSFVMEGSAWK